MFYLNGEILKKEPYDSSIFYAKSLFETIAIIRGKALFLDEHLYRMRKSAMDLDIPVPDNIKAEVEGFIGKYGQFEEGMLKIHLSENKLYFKTASFELRDFPEGIKAGFVEKYYQNELGMYKSSNYLSNILARKELSENGLFEGVFCNRLGHLTEGTISNLFFISEGKLKTPHLNLNILPGITRKKIIEIAKELEIEVQEGCFSKEDILKSEAVFFTNSLVKKGLIWVCNFEGIVFGKNEIVHNIENKYFKIQNTMV